LQRKGEAPIRFSTLDFEGVLVVRDPARFIAKVATGFGPQKAFGCGLMLLRRA
jgi:CRISPR system Cascade subunit CasE